VSGNGATTADTLDYSGYGGGAISVNLQTLAASLTGGFSGIENLVGSGNAGDTLTGADVANAWTISAANGGNINGTFTFSAVENLTGGAGVDTFTFAAGGTIAGNADGRADSDTLDFSALGPQTVTINGPGTVDQLQGVVTGLVGGFDNTELNGTFSVVVSGTAGDDVITVTPLTTSSIQYKLNSGATVTLNGVTGFAFNGAGGNDLMTVDLTAGGTVVTDGIAYDGQGQTGSPGDMLRLVGAGQNVTYTPDTATPGKGTLAVTPGGQISFTGLEPLDITGMAVATMLFPGTDDNVTVQNGADFTLLGANPAVRVSGTSGGVAFETVALWNNTTVVIDTATTDGNDTVALNSADVAHLNTNLQVNTGAGTDSISAGSTVGLVDFGINVAGRVTLSTAGPITDGNGAATDITAAELVMSAGTGIGASADPIESQVNNVEASGGTGGVYLANTGSLTIGGITAMIGVSATGGEVVIRTASPLVVTEEAANSGGGDITLAAEGSTGADDLTLSANVTASGGNGNISLYAGDTISLTGTITVSAAGTGAVLAMAGTDYAGGTPVNGTAAGDVSMADGTTIQSADGNVTLRAPGNVSLSIVSANSNSDATVGDVIVTADYDGVGGGLSDDDGAISDNLTGEAANITADELALRAGSGIGDDEASSDDDIDTQVDDLAAQTHSGDIHIENDGSLDIGSFDGLSGVENDADGAPGNAHITVRATSPLTVDDEVVNNDGGNITLAAEGTAADDDLTLNANVTATGGNGNINLYAGDAISLTGTITVSAAGTGAVLGMAGTDFADGTPANGTATGDVSMADGTTIQSADGNVTLRAPGNVSLSIVNANSNSDAALGDVIVTADYAGVAGGLSDNTGAISDNLTGEAANITGDQAALQAGSGVGDGVAPNDADIDVAINTLAAVTESGDIHVQDLAGGLTIDTFDGLSGVTIADALDNNGGVDHITIRASSPLTVSAGDPVVNNDGGNITLAAEGATGADDLTISANATATGGNGNINLYAGDTISLTGTITVSAAGTGAVLGMAGTNFVDGTPANGTATGDVSMADGTTIQSADGNITLRAPGNVSLSIVNANSNSDATLGDVIVTADYAGVAGGLSDNIGAISDNLTGEAANITGDQAALRAGSGIGDAVAPNDADIDVAINTLSAMTESGDIHVQDLAGGLTIDTFDSLSGVTIADALDNNSGADHITIRASSPLTVSAGDPVVNNDGGNITLAAEGAAAADDLTISANVTAAGGNGNINLYAGDTISLTGTITVSAAGTGAVLGMAGTNFADGTPANGTATGDVSMADGTTIQSADGNITLRAPGNVSLSIVNANSNSDATLGDVIVTADYAGVAGGLSDNIGAISDNLTGETANITGDQAALRAGSGIGDGVAPNDADIDVAINTLSAVTESGDIHLQDLAGGLTIDTFDSLSGVTIADALDNNSGVDHITIRASSPLSVSAGDPVVNNDGGSITLAAEGATGVDDLTLIANVTATGGNGGIRLYAGDSISLAGTVTVSAAGTGAILAGAGSDFNNGAPIDGNSGGDVVMASGSVIGSEGGNVTVLAPNHVQLSVVNADTDGTGDLLGGVMGNVIVTADYAGPDTSGGAGDLYGSNNVGAVGDNLAGEASNIVANNVALRAGSGIGDGEAPNDADIDVAINSLAAVTESGDIHVQDVSRGVNDSFGLTIDTFDGLSGVTITDAVNNNGGADHITIRASSPLTVLAGDPVVNNDGGSITLAAEGSAAADDLTINANVTATGGNGPISLYAGDSISVANSADITAAGTGAVLLSAGTNYNNGVPIAGAATGDVTVQSDTQIQSALDKVTITAARSVTLNENTEVSAPVRVTLNLGAANAGGVGELRGTVVSGNTVLVNGGTGNDELRFLRTAGLRLSPPPGTPRTGKGLRFDGAGGNDLLRIEGTDSADNFYVDDFTDNGVVRWTKGYQADFHPAVDAPIEDHPSIAYQNLETLWIDTLGGNDRVTFEMNAAGPLTLTEVRVDGGNWGVNHTPKNELVKVPSGVPNPGTLWDGLKIVGTADANTLAVGTFNPLAPVPGGPRFKVYEIAILQLFGKAGNDTLTNNTSVNAFLVGDEGNDVLTGGSMSDVLVSGKGNDKLYGMAGNDYLFADYDYVAPDAGHPNGQIVPVSPPHQIGGDSLDGGAGTDLGAYFGNDTLKNIERVKGKGGRLTPSMWLKAKYLPLKNFNAIVAALLASDVGQPFPNRPATPVPPASVVTLPRSSATAGVSGSSASSPVQGPQPEQVAALMGVLAEDFPNGLFRRKK
jgi:Ca2+-binding RTX toxin-like protein